MLHRPTLALALLLAAGCQATAPQMPATGTSTLHGVVNAAPGSRIEVEGGTFQAELTAGPDGSFSVQVPAGGLYEITAEQDDGQGGLLEAQTVAEATAPDVNVGTLVPQATGAIHGTVALADGGDPAGADVFVPGTHFMGKVGADGRFALDDLPAGDWTIVVEKPGYQRYAVGELTVGAGEPLVIGSKITLVAGDVNKGGLKTVLRDLQGRPVVGGQLTAIAPAGETYEASSDAQGNVQLAGLPPGTYQVSFFHPFLGVNGAYPVTIGNGATTEIGAVTMNGAVATGTIAGQVLDEAGKPIAGATVRLDPPGAGQVVSDGSGRFTFTQVEAGEYTVSAAATGYDAADRGVVLDPSGTAQVDQGLVLRTPTTGGQVLDAERPAFAVLPPDVTVERNGDDLTVAWTAEGLPPGASVVDYQLEGEVAPGVYAYLAHTTGTKLTLQGYGQNPARLRLTATAGAGGTPYQLTQVPAAKGIVGIGGVVIATDPKGMDLEAAMMAVQTQRANLLEKQLIEQMGGLEAANTTIRNLNDVLGALRKLQTTFKDDDKPETAKKLDADNTKSFKSFADYVVLFPTAGKGMVVDLFDANGNYTKKKLDAAVDAIKAQIDKLSASQQLDMLKLQSLTNKRNEAFDLMNNFIKKMSDSRASVVGNLR